MDPEEDDDFYAPSESAPIGDPPSKAQTQPSKPDPKSETMDDDLEEGEEEEDEDEDESDSVRNLLCYKGNDLNSSPGY